MVSYIIGLLLLVSVPLQVFMGDSKTDITSNQLQSIYGPANKQLCTDESVRKLVVVLDPGHGGKDTGCSGHSHLEKHITLAFTKELGRTIELLNPYITVLYTRTGDESVSLNHRVHLANQANADLFLSIHANAGPNEKVSGFETFVYGETLDSQARHLTHRENAVPNSHPDKALPMAQLILTQMKHSQMLDKSITLAAKINRRVSQIDKYRNRGIKQAQFRVLHKAQMPSVLLEIGYLTSPSDVQKLNDQRFKSVLVDKISTGIVEYLRQST